MSQFTRLRRVTTLCVIMHWGMLFALTLPAQAQKREPPLTPLDAYNFVLGTQTIGASYQFTRQPRLVETAQAILDMGSRTLKFALAADKDLIPKPQTLTDIVQHDPAVRTALSMPFANYLLWAYPLTADGFHKDALPAQYQEMYALARTLLQTYANTGKTFYLGNWEGDWHLIHTNPAYAPTPDEVQDMIAWVNNRQKAVDDAKRDTPHSGVQVYLYLEVNRVVDAMQGMTRMTNAVLPKTNVDFVSYSAYDSLDGDTEANLRRALDYIQAHLAPKAGFSGKRVFIGEFGLAALGRSPQEQDALTRRVARAALLWGCPFALYWSFTTMKSLPTAGKKGTG